jgi:hypothetical protein
MSELVLAYRCPVYVVVDTEAGEVVRVDCADTEVEPVESDNRKPYVVDGDDTDYAEAVKIADDSMWPAWRFV